MHVRQMYVCYMRKLWVQGPVTWLLVYSNLLNFLSANQSKVLSYRTLRQTVYVAISRYQIRHILDCNPTLVMHNLPNSSKHHIYVMCITFIHVYIDIGTWMPVGFAHSLLILILIFLH